MTEVAEWAMELHRPLGETPIALAHSLAGSSATVGFADLSHLSRLLEHALARSQVIGHGTDEEARLFVNAAEEIRRLLHQFAAGFLQEPSPELLRASRRPRAQLGEAPRGGDRRRRARRGRRQRVADRRARGRAAARARLDAAGVGRRRRRTGDRRRATGARRARNEDRPPPSRRHRDALAPTDRCAAATQASRDAGAGRGAAPSRSPTATSHAEPVDAGEPASSARRLRRRVGSALRRCRSAWPS